MANIPEIILTSGVIREGNTVEFWVNYKGDSISFLHPVKKWTVFAEKNIKFSIANDEFYYNEGDGEVYEAHDSDNIVVKDLVTGRLFCVFEYTDYFGQFHRIVRVYNVQPITSLVIGVGKVAGESQDFTLTNTLLNTQVDWSFSDDNSSLSGADVSKVILVDGYYVAIADVNYTNSKHSNGDDVIWGSDPVDTLPGVLGSYLDGISVTNTTESESLSGVYLSKYRLSDVISMDINFSKSVENTYEAPLDTIFTDRTTYQIGITGDNKIEYTELFFGDGESLKGVGTNFGLHKIYKRSGDYFGKFVVSTVHSVSGFADYRQTIEDPFEVNVTPFFKKWLVDHLSKTLFNSPGFDDLAGAWGIQMDRLYNEVQTLIDSIDVEKLDNKFIRAFSATYGDFPEIYEKVGFESFTKDNENKYGMLGEYNFFDRLQSGNLTKGEKQEFLNYIQSSRKRLREKGTPVSMELAIAQFGLNASVKELWTNSFDPKTLKPLKDEVFSSEVLVNKTGIKYRTISTPMSDNLNQVILNSKKTPYIEVNTSQVSDKRYYTNTSEKKVINGVEYILIEKQ